MPPLVLLGFRFCCFCCAGWWLPSPAGCLTWPLVFFCIFSSSLADVALKARFLYEREHTKKFIQGHKSIGLGKSIKPTHNHKNHKQNTTRGKSPSQTCVSPAEKQSKQQNPKTNQNGARAQPEHPRTGKAPQAGPKTIATLTLRFEASPSTLFSVHQCTRTASSLDFATGSCLLPLEQLSLALLEPSTTTGYGLARHC